MSVNRSIRIGDVEIRPGERRSVSLPMADLYTGAALPMQVHVVCGRREGPVLFVSAAIHGDELNGVEVIRRLLKRTKLTAIRGTLLAVPVVNVHGFLDLSRYLPDRRDLNRSFPGSSKGSIAARVAHVFITEVVDKATTASTCIPARSTGQISHRCARTWRTRRPWKWPWRSAHR